MGFVARAVARQALLSVDGFFEEGGRLWLRFDALKISGRTWTVYLGGREMATNLLMSEDGAPADIGQGVDVWLTKIRGSVEITLD